MRKHIYKSDLFLNDSIRRLYLPCQRYSCDAIPDLDFDSIDVDCDALKIHAGAIQPLP